MQGKFRGLLLGAVALLGVTAYKTDGNLMWAKLSFCGDALGRLAVDTLLPQVSYGREDTAYMSLSQQIAGWVSDTLFPADTYGESPDADEYYPSFEELEAFCEENENYEALEREAESRKAESEAAAVAGHPKPMAEGSDHELIPAVATPSNAMIYPVESLYDYTFLMNNFYVIDSSTASDANLINGEVLLNKDLTIDLAGESPKILIYHTHSQEKFADSDPKDVSDSVIGLGDTLEKILEEKYKVSVYHDRSVYDMIDGVEDRDEAYSLAQASVERILAENPSIKVVIDLHRDGVGEGTRLVTEVNGKPTAKIMFFNGLCRSANNDTSGYLQNPYLTENLAFSLQMQLKAAEKYPEFTRRIYLRNYRFNMHMCPRSLLVECGAQTNTVEEVQNAMEPLADLLYCVLSGQ